MQFDYFVSIELPSHSLCCCKLPFLQLPFVLFSRPLAARHPLCRQLSWDVAEETVRQERRLPQHARQGQERHRDWRRRYRCWLHWNIAKTGMITYMTKFVCDTWSHYLCVVWWIQCQTAYFLPVFFGNMVETIEKNYRTTDAGLYPISPPGHCC